MLQAKNRVSIGDAEESPMSLSNQTIWPASLSNEMWKTLKSQVSEIGRAVRNLSEQLLNQQSRDVSSRTFLFTDRERTPLRPLQVKQHSLTLLVCDQNFHGGQGWWMGRGGSKSGKC